MPTSEPDAATRQRVIVIVAAIILDDEGRLLLVRKRGTERFMQAGGKIDAGETAAVALVRELHEELLLVVEPGDLDYLGRFHAPAANEAGFVVDAEVFFVSVRGTAVASAEIEELVWVSPVEALALPLAPLTSEILLPLLAERAG
ncbi:NUDIX hydrolase [Conyzicola sp.]|uniref:NUDIX hydrolase n=1 Tax=Conyzicola sp. TaxID=1969404 RepID=UPI003989CC3B